MKLTPVVFISYSWDSLEHGEWVLNLANQLRENGVDAILDQYELSAGKDLNYFMEQGIAADKILVILTPNYKLKADKREGGVGFEYSMLTESYFKSEPNKTKILPILRVGNKDLSSPTFMKSKVYHDMKDDMKFSIKFYELIKLILDRPLIAKPPLGKLPDFSENKIPDLEKTILDYKEKEKFKLDKQAIINSDNGSQIFNEEVNKIFEQIEKSIENYRKNFGNTINYKKEPYMHCHDNRKLYSTHCYYAALYKRRKEGLLKMNLYQGIVGFDEIAYLNSLPSIEIYSKDFILDFNKEFTPIFRDKKNSSVKLTSLDIATVAIRELITSEIRLKKVDFKFARLLFVYYYIPS